MVREYTSGVDSFDTPAVVVRAVDYGEADRIVTLLTRVRGKVSAIARGARKSRRRFAGGLGLFAHGRATVKVRRGADLALLESWQPLVDHTGLAADVARMAHAGYVCEIARDLSAADHPDAEVFDLVAETLAVLSAPDRPPCVETLRVFELRLLDALGFAPMLDRCTACGRDDLGGAGMRFDLSRGGVTCRHCHGVGPELPEAARRALLRARGSSPSQAHELELDPVTNAACRDAMVAAIQHQLGRPLRSVEFIAKVKQHP
jgi:DNA repair protein RecO (recombination protein O)